MSTDAFISYSHADETYRDQLEKQLALLKRQGVIETWHDRRIGGGMEVDREINAHIESDSIILLLVSADFLASDYCYGIELQRALERQRLGEARVIPIILRACDWHDAPFGKLEALPTDGKPVTSWANRDEALTDVEQGIKKTVLDLWEKRQQKLRAQIDDARAKQIEGEISRDAQKQQIERSKILQDLQTKIFQIQQDVTVNQAATADRMANEWDDYIRSA